MTKKITFWPRCQCQGQRSSGDQAFRPWDTVTTRQVFWSACINAMISMIKSEHRPFTSFSLADGLRATWDEALNAPTCQKKADVFFSTVHEDINRHFPKAVNFHTSDNPWITLEIKILMKNRQSAFADKNMRLWNP